MDICNWNYQKGDGGKRESKPISTTEGSVENEVLITNDSSFTLVPEYSKGEGKLSTALFFVLSGGEVRERTYLQMLEKKRVFRSLRLVFLSSEKKAGGLTPNMMLDKWSDICEEGRVAVGNKEYHLMEFDKVFLFTDVDHYESDLRQILINESKEEHLRWIISNPCFEIWLYYSYYDKPENDLAGLLDIPERKRSSSLKRINGSLNDGGGIDTRKAFELLPQAIIHSKQHFKEDEIHFPELFSTQMHQFAEEVLEVLKEEYSLWLEEKKKNIRTFLDAE